MGDAPASAQRQSRRPLIRLDSPKLLGVGPVDASRAGLRLPPTLLLLPAFFGNVADLPALVAPDVSMAAGMAHLLPAAFRNVANLPALVASDVAALGCGHYAQPLLPLSSRVLLRQTGTRGCEQAQGGAQEVVRNREARRRL